MMMFTTFIKIFLLLWEVDDTDALSTFSNNNKSSKSCSEMCRILIPRNRCDALRGDGSVCLYLSTNNYNSNQIIPIESTRRERTVVILYHKPANVITSHSNSDEVSSTDTSKEPRRRTVYEDIFSMNGYISDTTSNTSKKRLNTSFADATQVQSKLHAVGRLDADSTGLLLLTNDGALIHKATNPNAKDTSELAKEFFQKTYECQIMGYHELPTSYQQSTSEYNSTLYPLQQLLDEGVALSPKHGGQTKPVDNLSILSHPSQSTTTVLITISEGKNRQIRRMFHAVGSGVMKLHRVSFGRLTLNGLKQNEMGDPLNEHELEEGQWRLLTEKEVELGLGYKCRYLDKSQIGNRKVSKGKSHRRRRRSISKQRNKARR